MNRDTYRSIVLKASSKMIFNISKDESSTTSLDKLFQCHTNLTVKIFFFISNLNLPSFSLKPFPLLLSQQTLLKSQSIVAQRSLNQTFLLSQFWESYSLEFTLSFMAYLIAHLPAIWFQKDLKDCLSCVKSNFQSQIIQQAHNCHSSLIFCPQQLLM